jgi:hypothetical protein
MKGFSTTDPHQAFWLFVAELAAILVLTVVADASEEAGLVIAFIFAALWLVYLIYNADTIAKLGTKVTGG